jgi:hypothetical protein
MLKGDNRVVLDTPVVVIAKAMKITLVKPAHVDSTTPISGTNATPARVS